MVLKISWDDTDRLGERKEKDDRFANQYAFNEVVI